MSAEEKKTSDSDLARENAVSDPGRLPDEGAPGLGSSDGEVPPDAIRGPGRDDAEDDDDRVEVEDLP
ncbi:MULTISPECIES: hypothetical protein [Microbacterium]|uniref:Uncharacterized protein n=1 Tax=Microbacterium barkeri TaxID=33917 RepID=A0A9W6H630_9MICO|nr:hypothetical protein [Microbacterium barkeri]MDR6878082.1 hypothetical protein [Microbacterium barkeri]GLJ63003.1 hypothetical protein GCM10017576_31340 [Microbacterium barkeri]